MLIQTMPALEAFLDTLAGHPYVAVDTEFVREKTYYAQLCLIQLAVPGHAAAIDVLTPGLDLTRVWGLLHEPSVVKVFHAAPQDLELLRVESAGMPGPIFDTQIGAEVSGFGEQPGYAKVVEAVVGVKVDKASQMTDWRRRPLTDRQLNYALSDVTHLCSVYETLKKQLEANDRLSWIAEEMKGLVDEQRYIVDPERAYERIKIRRPRRRTLGILRELGRWRELRAMKRNLPRRWVAKDEFLVAVAEARPRDLDGLLRVRGATKKLVEGRHGRELLECVARAMAMAEEDLPQSKGPSSRVVVDDSLVALLQALLRLRTTEAGVSMRLVATRKDLERIARGAADPSDRVMRGWRRELFGSDAISLYEGRLGLTGTSGQVATVAIEQSEEMV